MGRQPINQIGNVYGKWTVIDKDPQKNSCGQVCWICRCQCGTIKSISGKVLRRGKSQSCGCNNTAIHVGDVFGQLTVIAEDTKKDKYYHKYYQCQCSCGNVVIVRGSNLKEHQTVSCKCKTPRLNLINKRFGLLTVIEDMGNDSNGNSLWKCQCDCGKVKIIKGGNLSSGNTISCGCKKSSKGQLLIQNILKQNNLYYKRE